MYQYQIGDTVFIQKKLVLGQWKQLIDALNGVSLPDELDLSGFLSAFGSRIFTVLAIVLTKEGALPQNKDLAALAKEIEFGITPEDAIRAINDFFALNPIPSLLNEIGKTGIEIKARMMEIGSMKPAFSFPEETSQSGTGSSGA